MKHMTIEEFKEKIPEAIKEVNERDEPIFIGEKKEEPLVVLLSLDEFKNMVNTVESLEDRELFRKTIEIINDENTLKELGLSDDTLDKKLENSDLESALKDIEVNTFKKAYRENIDMRIEDEFADDKPVGREI